MPESLRNPIALTGRVLLALMFLLSGLSKIALFSATSAQIASKGLPMPELLCALSLILEILCALSVMIGYQARWGALALAGFTLLVSLAFHSFWAPGAQMAASALFMKNISVIGGLLLLAAAGPGAWSIDGRIARKRYRAKKLAEQRAKSSAKPRSEPRD